MLLRVQRATLARAVLVVHRPDGHILALALPSGEFRLPDKQLDAWIPVVTQVEGWLAELLQQASKPSLVAVDGTPGQEGVTFLFAAEAEIAVSDESEELWLDPAGALATLSANDNHLLGLCGAGPATGRS